MSVSLTDWQTEVRSDTYGRLWVTLSCKGWVRSGLPLYSRIWWGPSFRATSNIKEYDSYKPVTQSQGNTRIKTSSMFALFYSVRSRRSFHFPGGRARERVNEQTSAPGVGKWKEVERGWAKKGRNGGGWASYERLRCDAGSSRNTLRDNPYNGCKRDYAGDLFLGEDFTGYYFNKKFIWHPLIKQTLTSELVTEGGFVVPTSMKTGRNP